MRTFLQLQDAVLTRTGDEDDDDKMRTLAKEAINTVQRRVLGNKRYQFMIWPRVETLTLVPNQKTYALHPQFGQLWYGQNENTGDWLEEISDGGIVEMGDNIITGESDNPYRFILTGLSAVKSQPATAGVITVTTTGGVETSANSVIIRGIDSNGYYVTETLSSGANWTTLTGTTSFAVVESITKAGPTWTRTITVTSGSTTLLVLTASEYGRQYRMLELTKIPTANIDFLYRFYKKIQRMDNDYDMPIIPEEYDDILVYGALIDLQGYARPEMGELKEWEDKYKKLVDDMEKQYQQPRSVGARNTYINHIPR